MISQLRHRVRLETPATTIDEGGGQTLVWSLTDEVWARIKAVSGREIVRGSQIVPRVNYRVTIRHRADVAAGDRVVIDTEALLIETAADPDGKRRFLILDCQLVDGESL